MSLHVCVLGIDGSGKSTLVEFLPMILAAEMNILVGSAGESFRIVGPDEDHLAPKFHPDGLPISARLARRFKRRAKQIVGVRALYPAFKLAQMIFQDAAARELGDRYRAEVMVSDGNALLSATGRAANYLRPASDRAEASLPALPPTSDDLVHVFAYLLEAKRLPLESEARLPRLEKARIIQRLCRLFRLEGVWLPDGVIFLDISPKGALCRIASRHQKVDRHENEADLAQAREMYLETLEALQKYKRTAAVHRIVVDDLSLGEALHATLEALRPGILARREAPPSAEIPLGTTSTKLTGGAVWRKMFSYRYMFRYVLARWFRGAWRELTFVFSKLGRLLLKEGYSAAVMRVIYDQDEKDYGLLDRVFLAYPLHRAVYDRLQILTRRIEIELQGRLRSGRGVRIFTAPCGFAYDLFRPLAKIRSEAPELIRNVEIVAADLDPHGILAGELAERARELGVAIQFLRGDLTAEETSARAEAMAPFDIVLFVGLSSWLPKPQTVRHLRWLRGCLRQDGLLFTDSFTADAFALSGRYVGYKANYYTPEAYRALVDYCGFDGLRAAVESGRDAINHVLVASPRLAGRELANSTTY